LSRSQFFILAPYVAYERSRSSWHGDLPETGWIGIALVTTSAIGMPLLGREKRRLAHKLGSAPPTAKVPRTFPAATSPSPS
jgi:hypothetical protein